MMIKDEITAAIWRHADDCFPEECCGVVLESGQVVRLCNVSDNPRHAFRIAPEEIARHIAQTYCVYHSHPNRPATPSKADIASCDEIRLPFLIVSIPSHETFRLLPSGWSAPLEGRLFVYGVADCYSLVTDFYRQELQIKLPELLRPEFGWWNNGKPGPIEESFSTLGFREVEGGERGDVVLMCASATGTVDHLGVLLGNGHLLHHTLLGLSRQSPYDGYWKTITKKVIRYVGKS